jgi:hypothetical protein
MEEQEDICVEIDSGFGSLGSMVATTVARYRWFFGYSIVGMYDGMITR